MKNMPALLGAVLLLAITAQAAEPPPDGVYRPQDYDGKRIGIATGTIYTEVAQKQLPRAVHMFFNNKHDAYAALGFGKIDAVLDAENSALMQRRKQPELRILKPRLTNVGVGVALKKGNSALKKELDDFLEKIMADGTYDDMLDRWLEQPTPPPMPDIPPGDGKNGALVFGSAGITDGFSYYDNGQLVGIDIEIARRFASATGRRLELVTSDFGALIPAVHSGKLDIAANNFAITPERAENVDFSIPYYHTGAIVAVIPHQAGAAAGAASGDAAGGWWKQLERSFVQNILTEDRWLMILRGLAVTIAIAVAAFILGTVLGFLVCYLNMSAQPILRALGRAYVIVLRGTPIVVLLMIIYYVVFAKVNISSILVAIIAYGLNSGAYIGEIIRSAILTVDRGQIEAARSMGFSRSGAFLGVTLPQAVRVAMPVYKSEFVSLFKSTAVVGYIAVVDLTKAGDIIRSRTYDAFFPLVTVAVIYLVATGLMIWLFGWVDRRTDKRARRAKQ